MCFYLKQSKEAVELEYRYQASFATRRCYQKKEEVNGFTHPMVAVLPNLEPKQIRCFHWGLIPSWAKDTSIKRYTLNAKIETIRQKPSFKESVRNRCLVLVNGFYEWKWLDPKGKKKRKYLIIRPDNALFALAGIWSEWHGNGDNNPVYSFSIVTTRANTFMERIHNSKQRMPVILTSQNEQAWLDQEPIEAFKNVDVRLMATCVN